MLPAVAQTLAEILTGGTALISTEQIDFNHPGLRQDVRPALNLYCYNIRENYQVQHSQQQRESRSSRNQRPTPENCQAMWFDVSFIVSAWDCTVLGEQHLLSEALTLLLRHRWLKEELLAPTLRGYGSLSINISAVKHLDAAVLWNALGVRLRPALYVTVTAPLRLSCDASGLEVKTTGEQRSRGDERLMKRDSTKPNSLTVG